MAIDMHDLHNNNIIVCCRYIFDISKYIDTGSHKTGGCFI